MATKPPADDNETSAAQIHQFAETVIDDDGAFGATVAQADGDTEVGSPRGRKNRASQTVVAPGRPSAPIAIGPNGALAASVPLRDDDFADRYSGGDLLGQGGMGEVRQYLDSVVGRSVAIKFLRSPQESSTEASARFIREARVQGQLQHPSVLPVYDIGVTDDGATFFTMKRLGGRTMGEIIRELRELPPSGNDHGQRQLLTAFADVCLAVDYAHTRGVVHRDLKPANIMLGDFGEVYVLDWGLARLADGSEADSARSNENAKIAVDSGPIEAAVGVTSSKSVMGTIGYMAPEQLSGEPIGLAADVYALGSILFEILALEPLHFGSTAQVVIESTRGGCGERIRQRAAVHGIAPELETLCIDATMVSVDQRIQSAREVFDRLDRFLAGDRDLVRRREMATELAAAAEHSATTALVERDLEARKRAMRDASRALALDPEQESAPQTLMRLLLTPPNETPPAVREQLAAKRRDDNRRHARLAAAGYGSWLVAFPLFMWMGVVDWALGGAMIASVIACAAASFVGARSPRVATRLLVVGAFMNAATLFLLTRLLGPLILVPTLAVSTSLAFTLYGQRVATILGPLTAVLAIVSAVTVEALGWIPTSYSYDGGELRVISHVLNLRPVATTITLTALVGAAVFVAAWFVAQVRANLDRAEAANMTMLWQYRQLVPDGEE